MPASASRSRRRSRKPARLSRWRAGAPARTPQQRRSSPPTARAVAIEADVADEASCRALVARAVDELGRLDILVNNAGTAIRKQPQDYTLAEWRRVIDVNLTGAFLCAQAAYPHMLRAGGGKI